MPSGTSFLAQNANKKSVTLNLKDPRGREVFKRLAKSADVVVENFRPGTMDRLGLGASALMEENFRLIYAFVSGFGADGPYGGRAGYDQIAQGMSGLMSITGAAEGDQSKVARVVTAVD